MRLSLFKLGLGVVAVLAVAPAARAASTVNLSVMVDPASHTWQAFADVEDLNSSGLSAIQFDVTSVGGITLGTTQGASPLSLSNLPQGALFSPTFTSAGFYLLSAASDISTTDLQFRGGQASQYVPGTSGHGNIVVGFGKPGASGSFAGDITLGTPWSFPAIVAHGTYSGNSGSISISADPAFTALLPVAATVTSQQPFASHVPDIINGGTAAVPEPTAVAIVALGGIAALRRRRVL